MNINFKSLLQKKRGCVLFILIMSNPIMNKFNHARSSLQFQTINNNSNLAGFSKSSTLDQATNDQNQFGSLSSSYNDFKPATFTQGNVGGTQYVDGTQFMKTVSADKYIQPMDKQSVEMTNAQGNNNSQYQMFSTNTGPSDFGRHSSVMMMGMPMNGGDSGESNGIPIQGIY